jgi:lincosamide nucleotidyltransferase A/C/D/E
VPRRRPRRHSTGGHDDFAPPLPARAAPTVRGDLPGDCLPEGTFAVEKGNAAAVCLIAGYSRTMDKATQAQVRTIGCVVEALAAVNVSVWLFGGWGLDARIGRVTRSHSDIEFWVRRSERARSMNALVNAGSEALATQPPEESCEFVWDGVNFSTAYFDRRADGTFSLKGRWSDWVFPTDSFDEKPGLLDGAPVPAMSAAGMLAMKEQYPTLRNGRPWRDKDIGDIALLRSLRTDDRPRT